MTNKTNTTVGHDFGFLRVAAVTPRLALGDPEHNTKRVLDIAHEADKKGASLVVFPELSVVGYTLGDILHQSLLQEKALESLQTIKKESKHIQAVLCVGLPLEVRGQLFNVSAVVSGGRILGIVPKTYIPGYKEFYEERWFGSASDLSVDTISLFGEEVPVGNDIIFQNKENNRFVLGVEICEDLWAPIPPSSHHAVRGATIIANLSASNELVEKAEYRRALVVQQSARTICGYVYTSSGVHESTTDVVYSGHALIAESGRLLTEADRFQRSDTVVYADIDLDAISMDRQKITSFDSSQKEGVNKGRTVSFELKRKPIEALDRPSDPYPFVPMDPHKRDRHTHDIFSIQTAGLAKRLESSGIDNVIIGVSGGLDSTLALLVAYQAMKQLELPTKNIFAITMPGLATSKRTKSNAVELAKALSVSLEEIDITKGVLQQFEDIAHDNKKQDVTYENVQARYRTMILMNKANQTRGLVLGTGDLSELALGWNTFSGDQISHYNVNSGVPKTLVKHLVQWAGDQAPFVKVKQVLKDVVDTPISPELTKEKKGSISQKTEDILGPYELHDFFLYYFVRWGSAPRKILFLAKHAFEDHYTEAQMKKYLKIFLKRFFQNQWKRSVMPDGPKVGSVALSPRGDWRMPSDGEMKIWLEDLE